MLHPVVPLLLRMSLQPYRQAGSRKGCSNYMSDLEISRPKAKQFQNAELVADLEAKTDKGRLLKAGLAACPQ